MPVGLYVHLAQGQLQQMVATVHPVAANAILEAFVVRASLV